ncbi:RecX family transcriptional regulator [Paenibacillus alkaliterrae]|uniref:regulatory protein RecX n=1 Tax=Paenibacillus alkaliterrae TaxID=320909 RepID=UPI001F1A1225|nr:RecX family transcriptional regulator [Paenibacillus alkaliterrae]MCF2937080.1 RecX family transcriptional regulator [Paenibacillus alkaliterrae]
MVTIELNDAEQWMVLSVRPDKKERRLYHLYAKPEEPLLSVHEDILIRYRLMKGQQLSVDQIEEIRKEDERYRAYVLAIGYLGAKPRTRKQIQQYLLRKLFEESNIQYALDRLEREHIVDDEQYARQFAAGRMRSSLKGRRWIKQELQQRGVSKQAAAEATDALGREDELAAAKCAADKKWRSLKGEPLDKKRKLMGYLMRRGFPGDIVKEAIKNVEADDAVDPFDDEDGLLLDN